MVRGPAALLGALALALAYGLCATTVLPDLGTGDDAVLVAACSGVLVIAAVALAVVWAGTGVGPAALLAVGGGLLAAVLGAAGEHAAAIAPEALFAGAFGVLLARGLVGYAGPAVALAVPVFVALVDVWSVAMGPSSRLIDGDPRGVAALTFDLPWWGGSLDGPAARLGLPDAIFLAAFATWAVRLGLRPRAAAIGMVCGLLAAIGLSIGTGDAVPALPLLAVGFLVPNVDRIARLLRPDGGPHGLAASPG